MSFYGNQYLEFQKFFYKILFKSSGLENFNFPKDEHLGTEGYRTEPNESHDELIIDTANRWIRMQKHGNNHINLFHAQPDPEDEAAHTDYKPIYCAAAEENNNVLAFGDAIEVQPFRVDPAGHITNVTTNQQSITYTLPTLTFTTTDNNGEDESAKGIFKIIGDDWITPSVQDGKVSLEHYHSLAEEPTSIQGCAIPNDSFKEGTILKEGATLTFPVLTYDSAGHLTATDGITVQLPTSPTGESFNAYDERLEAVEELSSGNQSKISKINTLLNDQLYLSYPSKTVKDTVSNQSATLLGLSAKIEHIETFLESKYSDFSSKEA